MTLGNQPATGRSFVVLIVIGTLAAIVVTIWTFRSSTTKASGAASNGFRI